MKVNASPLHITRVVLAIFGLGFTVTTKFCVAPLQVASVGVMV